MSRGTVWWDFDGTLISRPAMFAEAASRVVRRLAPDSECPDDELVRAMDAGMPWHRPDGAHPELTTAQQWWDEVFRRSVEVFRELGLTPATTSTALEAIRQDILTTERYRVYDDVEPALSRLRDAGWRQVIVSNHVPELPDLVEQLGLAPYFSAIVTSGVVGYEKPHPRMFEAALAHSIPGVPIWMIGDNLTADCHGVAPFGVHAILVRTRADPAYERQASGLDEAVRLIESTRG